MASQKPLVLVLGATGRTGVSIVKGLLESGNFRVAAVVRPESASKPAAQALAASGVEIRLGELTDDADALKRTLSGVDILIGAVSARVLEDQKPIFRAAKEVGTVKRIIPTDWATPGEAGIRELHDRKLAIREFVKQLGVPYTFIDTGVWMQGSLPLLTSDTALRWRETSWSIYGRGDVKTLLTDLRHIGTYVARIVADPRTENRAVIIWEDEPTQSEAHDIGEKASGEEDVLKAKRVYVSAEEILASVKDAKERLKRDPSDIAAHMQVTIQQYMHSIGVLGENTLETAKRLGYLDARELYPDIPPYPLEEFAKEFYKDVSLRSVLG